MNFQKNPNTIKHFQFALISAVALILLSVTTKAQDLLIYPKRIVFEGPKKRSEIINLTNTGKDTAHYDISFVQIRMREDGSFENIRQPDAGQLFANEYLRYFPRKVVLAPNESQVIKIQVIQMSTLAPGEYRSHLFFRAVPNNNPLGEKEIQDENDAASISIRLTPVYGITIPTIIRIGEPSANVNLSDLSFEMVNEIPVVNLRFNREGDMSVYGDIEITHTSQHGKKTKVSEIAGFAVYTPGKSRKAKIELKRYDGVDYRSGKLSVSYFTQEAAGKKIRIAEAELLLH